MAAVSLQGLCEEALCSICLDYFKDPATIECGHNFCRACLTRYWEGLKEEEVSCPQCRQKVRKSLILNRQLANFVELTRKLQLRGEKSPKGKRGVCGKHQEPLKLFCKEDEAPICVVCDRSKEHRNHNVVPLEEAAQDYKDLISGLLEVLEKERATILACKSETEEESQALLKQIKAEMEKTKEQFGELISFLNEHEKLVLAQLEDVEKEIARNRDERLARLSEELSSLGGLIQEMEDKCQQSSSELLQDVREILQRCEKKAPFQDPLAVPPELKWRFWDLSDINAFLAKKTQQFRDSLLPGFHLQKATVTLDPNTAHPRLVVSNDCKSARYGEKSQPLSNNPEKFDRHPFALGREGFVGGRHYWEVAVGGEEDWAVGVARKSVRRKGTVVFETEEGIWAVGKWGGECRTSSGPDMSFLSSRKLRKIHVSLNYEGGQVAFHDADTGSHLYTFSGASFSGETLLPFFCVWGKASLTIST